MWTNVTNATTSNAKESDNKNQTKVTELTPVKETTTTSGEEKSDTDVSDISISKFSDISNSTLKQNNITKTIYDTHQYYNSTFIIDADICKKYWVDMDNHPELRVNHLLSQSHRRAAVRIACPFSFFFPSTTLQSYYDLCIIVYDQIADNLFFSRLTDSQAEIRFSILRT